MYRKVLPHLPVFSCHCFVPIVMVSLPAGKGLASSAALEVAVMQALNVALKLHLDGQQVAQYCHKV